ncbi:hypothetical protein ACJ73_06428 [Blastomyces percursus]|uniref:Uncharacterized protein n=1 Tax=Blastomyces percursus TaxID=1658174 RepID=A0A1J9R3N7_9EURO|nr:hypothetical protein ACJ73_06428 [Blastomyces percursus]
MCSPPVDPEVSELWDLLLDPPTPEEDLTLEEEPQEEAPEPPLQVEQLEDPGYDIEERQSSLYAQTMASIVRETIANIQRILGGGPLPIHPGYMSQIRALLFFLRSWRSCIIVHYNKGKGYVPSHRLGDVLDNLLNQNASLRRELLHDLRTPMPLTLMEAFPPVCFFQAEEVAEQAMHAVNCFKLRQTSMMTISTRRRGKMPARAPTPTPTGASRSAPPGRGRTASIPRRLERAPPIKTYSASEVWETVHLGDYWMDGISTLHPEEHPLWRGYIDAGDINPEHAPPFYRQLITE